MNRNAFSKYTGITLCIVMIIACFLPWTHYNSINETFSGFHSNKFAAGVKYGRPGILITILAAVIFVMNIWKSNYAKVINLFICGFLFAYCLRTYILFTGSLFKGEVENLVGIYLILIISFLLLVASVFPEKTAATK